MKVVFLHPDLGIGGAERLVVDAGLSLQEAGHSVAFVTAHHDVNHCFKETKDGTLSVTVVGDFMPRSVFGKCYALMAYLRIIVAAFYLVFTSKEELCDYDIIFCDQISACIPVLKWFSGFRKKNAKVVFYCHFPDQLLTKRNNYLKKIYRIPIDWIEEMTTGLADSILVNSNFTAGIFRQTFRRLNKVPIEVLYPICNFAALEKPVKGDVSDLQISENVDSLFLSLNRYERKKNLQLALHSFTALDQKLKIESKSKRIHLIIAGGYDNRVLENKEYYDELLECASTLGIANKVSFLKSPSDSQKQFLLHSCTAVLYTPENEHFGIVPLEAMYMRRPVIACNSGGPLETIVDGETGFLCDPGNTSSFVDAMYKFVIDKSLAREMGINGHERVRQHFSNSKFKKQLNNLLTQVIE